MLGGQLLGPLRVEVDDGDQVDPVGQFADHRPVDGADNAGTDKGQSDSPVGFADGAHAYAIPSLVRMSVKAFQALVNRSGPDSAPNSVYSPRCGSSEKNPSKPSARRARTVSRPRRRPRQRPRPRRPPAARP